MLTVLITGANRGIGQALVNETISLACCYYGRGRREDTEKFTGEARIPATRGWVSQNVCELHDPI